MTLLDKLVEWWRRATYVQPHDEAISQAMNNLLEDGPGMRELFERITKDYTVSLTPGELPPSVLGRTIISPTAASIIVDVSQVRRYRDSLEAVIGHELIHISDAQAMGVEAYIAAVKAESTEEWWHKQVEASVVKQEDALRAGMRATGKYPYMQPTRGLQNIRNGRR